MAKEILLLNFCWLGVPLVQAETLATFQALEAQVRLLKGGAMDLADLLRLGSELTSSGELCLKFAAARARDSGAVCQLVDIPQRVGPPDVHQ